MASVASPSGHGGLVLEGGPRPPVSIDRLPIRRHSNEPKEAMNCKSCRKRKIKCNRVRPICESCTTFSCLCVYDAIPQKRGPKTGSADGTPRRRIALAKIPKRCNAPERIAHGATVQDENLAYNVSTILHLRNESTLETASTIERTPAVTTSVYTPQCHSIAHVVSTPDAPASVAKVANQSLDSLLLDLYFSQVHGNPYYILDEAITRRRHQESKLPTYTLMAISAVSINYAPQLCGGYTEAARSSRQCLLRSRADIDVDEPSIGHIQALLLLALASHQHGNGKKSCMLLCHAISMATVLGLHRELPSSTRVASSERENQRSLFWSCYLMDRFSVTGSKRPTLIADEAISLQLPTWPQHRDDRSVSHHGANQAEIGIVRDASHSNGAMLVKIAKVLSATNRYLAAGGVKGDSHFPWHAQSTLTKIRGELDCWMTSTRSVFNPLETSSVAPESPALVLSRLIYHVIHCLIFRPFLPVDLTELAGAGQNQSWQIEATNFCFVHANAIADIVETGKTTGILYWSSFVGYCICTAGTVHVHGAHYVSATDETLAARSANYLSREMAQLTDLRQVWVGVQHQLDTLKVVYTSHAVLVKSLANSPMRYAPVFQMEDFFARYPETHIDGAHVSITDVDSDSSSVHHGALDMSQPASRDWQHTRGGQRTKAFGAWPPQQVPGGDGAKAKKRRMTESTIKEGRSQVDVCSHANMRSFKAARISQTSQHTPALWDQNFTLPSVPSCTEQTLDPGGLYHSSYPIQQSSLQYGYADISMDAAWGTMYSGGASDHHTPGDVELGAGSTHTDGEKDPFLTLLEQMAENDGMQDIGLNDLNSFLNG